MDSGLLLFVNTVDKKTADEEDTASSTTFISTTTYSLTHDDARLFFSPVQAARPVKMSPGQERLHELQEGLQER